MFLIVFFTSGESCQCLGSCVLTAASEKADVRLDSISRKLGLGRRETSALQLLSCNEGIKILTVHS